MNADVRAWFEYARQLQHPSVIPAGDASFDIALSGGGRKGKENNNHMLQYNVYIGDQEAKMLRITPDSRIAWELFAQRTDHPHALFRVGDLPKVGSYQLFRQKKGRATYNGRLCSYGFEHAKSIFRPNRPWFVNDQGRVKGRASTCVIVKDQGSIITFYLDLTDLVSIPVADRGQRCLECDQVLAGLTGASFCPYCGTPFDE